MHRIILVRHAKSDWSHHVDDHDRTLNDRGRRDAPEIGVWLREHAANVDAAFVSSALRTQQTWELLCTTWGSDVPMVTESQLYEASSTRLLTFIEALPETFFSVVIVAHNPGISDVVDELCGTTGHMMKTSAIADITLDGPWAAARGNGVLRAEALARG